MYLEVKDLCKSYGEGGSYTQVLKNVSLKVQQGDMCVIQGTHEQLSAQPGIYADFVGGRKQAASWKL